MASDFILRSRHGTVFHFRRRVPKDLVARIGRSHIVVSLRTEACDAARCRARTLATATDRLFSDLRNMANNSGGVISTKYDFGADFDPLTGNLTKVQVSNATPADQQAIDQHIASLRELGAAASGAPVQLVEPDTPTVGEAAAAILADSTLKPTTRKRYAAVFAHFAAHFGEGTRLGTITQERFAGYADLVLSNAAWKEKTQGFYLAAAQRLFGVYEARNSAVPKITIKGLKPKRQRPAGQDRDAFTLDHYRILLTNAARYRHTSPQKWWVTVACAFLGCRLEELAQAHLDGDFLQDEASERWYLKIEEVDVDDAGISFGELSSKSVKTLTSWRRVPLHPALIEAGFLDFLRTEREAGSATPFARQWAPYLDPETKGIKHSHSISKWGSRELAKLRKEHPSISPKLSYFHSMRHGFTTLLASADIGEEWRAALAGHAFGGMNSQVYNKAKQEVALTGPQLENGLVGLAETLTVALGGLAPARRAARAS